MNRKNTMSVRSYIGWNIYWGVVSIFCFRRTLFKCIFECSYTQSKAILWGLFLILMFIGIRTTLKDRRNNFTILLNVSLPLTIFGIVSYRNFVPLLSTIAIYIGFILAATFTVMVLKHKRPLAKNNFIRRLQQKSLKKMKLKHSFHGSRAIIGLALLVAFFPIAINAFFGNSVLSSNVSPSKGIQTETWTVANNIDTVSNLIDENWTSLSEKQKLNTLQTIANIECRYLGLPHELNVAVAALDKNTLAAYNDDLHTIYINADTLESEEASEILDSLCHEAYHAYQYNLCEAYSSVDDKYKDLLAFYHVPFYIDEFSNYTDGNTDYFDYYFQHCEMNARDYAKQAVDEYYERIFELTEEAKTE